MRALFWAIVAGCVLIFAHHVITSETPGDTAFHGVAWFCFAYTATNIAQRLVVAWEARRVGRLSRSNDDA